MSRWILIAVLGAVVTSESRADYESINGLLWDWELKKHDFIVSTPTFSVDLIARIFNSPRSTRRFSFNSEPFNLTYDISYNYQMFGPDGVESTFPIDKVNVAPGRSQTVPVWRLTVDKPLAENSTISGRVSFVLYDNYGSGDDPHSTDTQEYSITYKPPVTNQPQSLFLDF